MSDFVVIKPGTPVIMGDIKGTIIGVIIRESGIASYEVAWWDGFARTVAWVDPVEVKIAGEEKPALRIGFHREDSA